MKTMIALGLGPLMLATAFSMGAEPPSAVRSAFHAEIAGDVNTLASGEAHFGMSGGGSDAPAVFTISLGASRGQGAVLFTRVSGERLTPGRYRVSDDDADRSAIRGLVVTGSPTKPTGVFQARSGTLVIASASEREMRGTFRIEAEGFLAADPENEHRPIRAAGGFTATR
jgi:hypothetical protein